MTTLILPCFDQSIGEPQGLSPSGSMTISTSAVRCAGFESCDAIVITYSIPSDIQKSYHVNPGQRQHGKQASAYLPNNLEGRDLLKRLKYAFMHGLTFTVGTSMTTNAQNQCTWSSIHHKSQPSGGLRLHGFPDPNYFDNCNKELDSLNVPSAAILDDAGCSVCSK
jgi:deltex-like protein